MTTLYGVAGSSTAMPDIVIVRHRNSFHQRKVGLSTSLTDFAVGSAAVVAGGI
jgi:hypothetical protein